MSGTAAVESPMQRILISACLLGERVRYDGRGYPVAEGWLERWSREGRVVPLCPEVAGGLPVPRAPAEIQRGDGAAVLAGAAEIVNREGTDVTAHFRAGAEAALAAVRAHEVRIAVLKARSPSCGSGRIYDGTFSGTQRDGDGVTAALLRANGVAVFDETQLDAAAALLARLERD